MIAHTSLPVVEYAKSKAFYVRALEPLGVRNDLEYGDARARDNGGPGFRDDWPPSYLAALVHEPDGHNIEAVWYDYARASEQR